MTLNYTTITETFKDGSGSALSPVVTFVPSQAVYSAGSLLATPATPVVASIVNGALKAPGGAALTLLATDNAGLSFSGGTGFFFWTVTVSLGGITDSWDFFLPSSPATADLYALKNTASGSGGSSASFLTPELGFAIATLPGPWAATNGSTAINNEIVATLATAAKSATITKLGTWIGGAGVTPGAGVNGLAIYSEAGVLLAATGDMTAAFETVGYAEGTLTQSVQIVAGTNYYLAYQNNFTGTQPAIPGFVPAPSSGVPAIHGHYPHLFITGQTSWPASFTPSSEPLNGQHWFWVTGSA